MAPVRTGLLKTTRLLRYAQLPLPGLPVVLIFIFCNSLAFGMVERPTPTPPPVSVLTKGVPSAPVILSSGRDTTWLQVHTDSTYCPGDPAWGHGGETTGGPGPRQTWCFEGGFGDSCGTNPPWDTNCFTHTDVRAEPSNMGINFWHIDTYRADQRPYCGNYSLWCGSDSLWADGQPVECNTWAHGRYPGYGNYWNCIVQLNLPDTFSVANGCTLLFDPRYDTECTYDYLYVDFWNGTEWKTLATFNTTSNTGGGTCGYFALPTPDYFGNSDTGQPNSGDWQERINPDEPAFKEAMTPAQLGLTSGPSFRWRFTSDGAWSDADGRGDTDGAAFIDNVWVWGDEEQYTEDFEIGALDTAYWSLPDPDPMRDNWHIRHNPSTKYIYWLCTQDTSWAWSSRPPEGYKIPNRNRWHYRLVTPAVPVQNSDCTIQWDEYDCVLDYTCDYPNWKVRFYDADYGKWCPWKHVWYFWWSSCSWNFDTEASLKGFYDASAESLQFSWGIVDVGQPGDFCYGKHTDTQLIIDNVSIGFHDKRATGFRARGIDIFQDTFFESLCAYSSSFDAYDPDTVNLYSGPPYDDVPLPKGEQLRIDVTDGDGLSSVELYGAVDGGGGWASVEMTLDIPADPGNPSVGGEYCGTLCPTDLGLDAWDTGTEIWYYVKAVDNLANEEYWPARADPLHGSHTGGAEDYMTFSILPLYPDTYTGPKILLVDGYGRRNYDFAECMSAVDNTIPLQDIYGQALTDAGYCYDIYDISGAGSNVHVHPIWLNDYDCVVWFTGPYFSNYLFDAEAQRAIRDYLGAGGKVVLLGDRIAYNMDVVGEDSLGGEFLAGIMGCDYLSEMEGGFDKPYLYAAGVDTLQVFGLPVAVDLDTLLIYRECPYLKDMSYVATIDSPPAGYTAQRLAYVTNAAVGEPDEVIYTEYHGVGQCVFVNFDLCASANHERTYCSGDAGVLAPDFTPGTYDGRVDLMRVILEDVFALPSNGGGTAHVETPVMSVHWALHQNVPNPSVTGTEIRYEVGRPVRVRIRIYNALGREVLVLVDGPAKPGIHSAHWDGCSRTGERVTSGVYFYKIEAGAFTATRKMLVLR